MGARYFCCLLAAAGLLCASTNAAEPEAIRVILVGDSTMATRTGYGDALCRLFQPNVTCINLARGGRSSGSFRAEGLWDSMLNQLRGAPAYRTTYVLIQFGHNDQPGKPGRSTDLVTEFPVNMARYVDEVKAGNAVPVLVTPLTRRQFRDNALQNDLKPWAEATRRVAESRRLPLLDLNADSATAVAAMGPAEADTLAMAPPPDFPPALTAKPADIAKVEPNANAQTLFDHTHLGAKGAAFFAGMVAQELARAVPALALHFKPATPTRPQLTPGQAAKYSYAEVLKYSGRGDDEKIDPWDPLADPLATGAVLKPDYTVDATAEANGRTVFNSVQSAVSRAVADSRANQRGARQYIRVKPGIYRELLYVPESHAPITIYGIDADAARTRLSADLHAGTPGATYARNFGGQFAATDPAIATMFASLKDKPVIGTPGSAIAWIRNTGFQARNITFENAWNRGDAVREVPAAIASQHVQTFNQAVAMMVDGADKVQFENVRFLGYQDTLFLTASVAGRTARSFFNKSYIEGDTDFIFGDATAYFFQSEIKSLGAQKNYSYVTAPSTHLRNRFGFVFNECRFTHDGTANALAGNFKLTRQWFRGQKCTPYGTVTSIPGYTCSLDATDTYEVPAGTISREVLETVGKVIILNSRMGAHIDKAQPWADWNAPGTIKHRPAQFSTDDYWSNLVAAGIDPARQMGYAVRHQPAGPFLAEYNNTDE